MYRYMNVWMQGAQGCVDVSMYAAWLWLYICAIGNAVGWLVVCALRLAYPFIGLCTYGANLVADISTVVCMCLRT